MITDKIISITDLRKNATKYINDLDEKIIVVNNKPKAVLINIEEYEKHQNLEKYEKLIENVLFLANNKSLDFLKEEPDLYEEY